MKVRIGYVTNSSSTNFLILSKEELTPELLYEKLGFKKDSIIRDDAMELCNNILSGTIDGLEWNDLEEINQKNVKELFGEKAENIYLKMRSKGFKGYIGRTSCDEGDLTSFFTTDSFEIENRDFYLNARECIW